jgi:hypothetical protein
MVAVGIFPYKGKLPTAEMEIEHGNSCLVVRSSDHQATRLVYGVKTVSKETLLFLMEF